MKAFSSFSSIELFKNSAAVTTVAFIQNTITMAAEQPETSSATLKDAREDPEAGKSAIFRFMDLPPELRNRIYLLIVPQDETYTIFNSDDDYTVVVNAITRPVPPALVQTCRQLRKEAMPLWRSLTQISGAVQG